jgi:hypothetical protein
MLKVAMDEDIRSPPVIPAKTFVRAFGEFLRDIGYDSLLRSKPENRERQRYPV